MDIVAHIDSFAKAIPGLTKVEFLSSTRKGVGTKNRETRSCRREASTELEVTKYAVNERVRIVADSHGAVWDTVFTVEPRGDQTQLRTVMDARPHKLLAKMMVPLTRKMVQKAALGDMDAVKAYCEAQA